MGKKHLKTTIWLEIKCLTMTGAGSGNRTRIFSLEGCCSTIELYPPVCAPHAGTCCRVKRKPAARYARSVPHGSSRIWGRAGRMTVAGMVGEVGLEPTKHYAADLQSAPFAARDIPPFRLPSGRVGYAAMTCPCQQGEGADGRFLFAVVGCLAGDRRRFVLDRLARRR